MSVDYQTLVDTIEFGFSWDQERDFSWSEIQARITNVTGCTPAWGEHSHSYASGGFHSKKGYLKALIKIHGLLHGKCQHPWELALLQLVRTRGPMLLAEIAAE